MTWRFWLLLVTLPRGRSRSGTTHPTDFESETSMATCFDVFSSFSLSSYSEWSEVKWSEGEGEVKRRGIPSQCSGFSFTVTLQKCSKTPKTASPVVHRWEALVNFPCDFKSSRERLWIETIPWLLGQLWSNHSGQFIWIFVWNVPPRV